MNLSKETYGQFTKPMQSHINVGSGIDITISELANEIATTVGFEGGIKFDVNKPDGSPRKLMDSRRLNDLGWAPKMSLSAGLSQTYKSFVLSQKP